MAILYVIQFQKLRYDAIEADNPEMGMKDKFMANRHGIIMNFFLFLQKYRIKYTEKALHQHLTPPLILSSSLFHLLPILLLQFFCQSFPTVDGKWYSSYNIMNIQNLLKKIGERRDKRKEVSGAISTERVGKGNYDDIGPNQASIGTLNQMPNTQNDRSYFKQYFSDFATEESKEESKEESREEAYLERGVVNAGKSNKLERIESQLDEIEKMKCVFENKKRLDTHGSIERNCPNRSVQKHTLKPSQVPKFKQTSEFVINQTCDFKDNHSGMFKDESFAINKTEEVISFKGAEMFDDSRVNSKRSISLRNDEFWDKSRMVGNSHLQRCLCEATLKDFMAEIGQKMGALTSRISDLEESNANLKAKHDRVVTSNMKAAQILQRLQEEKNELIQTQQKWSQSKNELETLLKGVMIKKDKEVPKENMSKQDCQNYFKNRDKSKSPVKKHAPLQDKKGGNKNKVQCLLQRLQLRVQKS